MSIGRQAQRHGNKICPDCGSNKITTNLDRAEEVCSACGLVITDTIFDTGPESTGWDDKGESRFRGGPSRTPMIISGLSTTIDWRNVDGRGKEIGYEKRGQIRRMRKWQKRENISGAQERNLSFALPELGRLTSNAKLTKHVKDASAVLYRRCVEEKIIRGRSIEAFVAACVYATCRQAKTPKSLDEITEHTILRKKQIGEAYTYICRKLGIKLPPADPIDYIPQFSSALKLSPRVQNKAKELIYEAIEKGLSSGRSPMGLVAAALYIASMLEGEKRTQHDVSEACDVTEVTVRNRYKELQNILGIDAEEEWETRRKLRRERTWPFENEYIHKPGPEHAMRRTHGEIPSIKYDIPHIMPSLTISNEEIYNVPVSVKSRKKRFFDTKKTTNNRSRIDPRIYVPELLFNSGLEINSEIVDRAIEILEDDRNKTVIIGKPRRTSVATALYLASILEGNKISQNLIAKALRTTGMTIRTGSKEFCRRMDIDIHGGQHNITGTALPEITGKYPTPSISEYQKHIEGISSEKHFPPEIQRRALDYIRGAIENPEGWHDIGTMSTAAAALYLACRENGFGIPQKEFVVLGRASQGMISIKKRRLERYKSRNVF